MKENAEFQREISTFILKVSRKIKGCSLSGLATRKVTCMANVFSAFLCVCSCADFMGNLTRNKQREQVQ